MTNGVERLRNVNRHRDGSFSRLFLIETVGDGLRKRKKSGDRRSPLPETVLRVVADKMFVEIGKEKTFKDFRCRAGSDMGRYEGPSLVGLPGLRMGRTNAFFQIAGTSALATEMLKSSVK